MRPEHLQLATFIGRSSVNCLLGIEHLDPGGREGRPLTAHGSLSDA